MSVAALRKMADLGLTLDQAIEVMEAMGAEPARSPGAERQARYRARKAEGVTSDVTRDVTPSVTSESPEPTPFLEDLVPPSPPKGGSVPQGTALAEPKSRRAKTGSRFVPADFEPTQAHHDQAVAAGLSPGEFDRALRVFRNHEFPRPYTDWNRTFTNWLDREKPSDERSDHNRSRTSNAPPSRAERDQSAALVVLARRGLLPESPAGRGVYDGEPPGLAAAGGRA